MTLPVSSNELPLLMGTGVLSKKDEKPEATTYTLIIPILPLAALVFGAIIYFACREKKQKPAVRQYVPIKVF